MSKDQKDTSIFRKEALTAYASSSRIDSSIKIVKPKHWIMGIILSLIISFGLAWIFYGSVSISVNGKGILVPAKGALFNAVAPEGATRLISLAVSIGDKVTKGTVIAKLESPNLQDELNAGQTHLKKLLSEQSNLSKRYENELKQEEQLIETKHNILLKTKESQTRHLQETENLLKIKTQAQKKGIISKLLVFQTTDKYYQITKEIERTNGSLHENKIKITEFKREWAQRLLSLNLKVLEQRYKVDLLSSKLASSNEVLSPIKGVVTSINVSIGEKIDGGEIVATIVPDKKDLEAIIYVPAAEGKRIKAKMKILVSPTIIKKEEYGSIVGTVRFVSSFPSTEKDMLAVLHNEALVKSFIEEGAPITLRATLFTSNKTYSSYQWTSTLGPDQIISAGTLVNAQITIKKVKPIVLIIPAMKKLMEID